MSPVCKRRGRSAGLRLIESINERSSLCQGGAPFPCWKRGEEKKPKLRTVLESTKSKRGEIRGKSLDREKKEQVTGEEKTIPAALRGRGDGDWLQTPSLQLAAEEQRSVHRGGSTA